MSTKQQNNTKSLKTQSKVTKTPSKALSKASSNASLNASSKPSSNAIKKKSKNDSDKESINDSNSDSDSDSDSDSNSDSDSDSNSDSDNDSIKSNNNIKSDNDTIKSDKNTNIKKDKIVKQKKEVDKILYTDLIIQINELRQNKKLRKIKFLEVQKEYEKEDNTDDKHLDKLLSQLLKVHNDEKNSISKIKVKKTPKQNTGGIHKLDDVPSVFLKFFGKEENTQMAFKDILSQLHSKFKELGLKSGQKTTLDEKTAKLFNHPEYPAETVIDFSGYGTFIKKICAHYSVKNNNVSL